MAECILTDVTVRVEDRVGMMGGVTIMWVGHEAFVQLPRDLRVNREPVTFGALLMIINENALLPLGTYVLEPHCNDLC